MVLIKALLPLALAGFATAKNCSTFLIETTVTSRQGHFQEIPIDSNVDVGAFITRFLQFQHNYTQELLEGYQTLEKTYNISAQYCQPHIGSSDTIQLLSHGVGFDKTYWDLDYNDHNYSYINVALEAGYSTLAIDRLGIGNSSHGDPLNEIQAQAEVQALNEITTMLRNGDICEIGRSFKKVIHVGHSFGSIQSYWLSALYPENTDGVVLTGFSVTPQFLPYIMAGMNLHSARLNQPMRFGNLSESDIQGVPYSSHEFMAHVLKVYLENNDLDRRPSDKWHEFMTTEVLDLITGFTNSFRGLKTNEFSYDYPSGYMTTSCFTALQYGFLQPGNYDIKLGIRAEKTKQPVTTGELLTIAGSPMSSPFTGPVLVITGENDVPFCGGNCYGQIKGTKYSNIPENVALVFPHTSAFQSYIQPNTGHGLNLHYNATAGYRVIQHFLTENDLAA